MGGQDGADFMASCEYPEVLVVKLIAWFAATGLGFINVRAAKLGRGFLSTHLQMQKVFR
jgi:hypothetical protein